MNFARQIRRVWLVSFTGYCVCLTFAIAYSHVLAGVAIVFLLVEVLCCDTLQSPLLRLSATEKRLYLLFGAYVTWEVFSALINDSPARSLWTLKEEWLFLFVPLAHRAMREERWRERFLIALAFSTIVVGSYGWLQHFFLLNLRPDYVLVLMPSGFARASGAFHNTLTFGNLFAVLGVTFVTLALYAPRPSMRCLYGLAGAMAVGAAAFSYSRGPIIALVVGLALTVAFSLKVSRRLALGAFAVMVISGAILGPKVVDRFQAAMGSDKGTQTLRDKSVSRITIWSTTLEMISQNPFFGVGPGNFYEAYEKATPELSVHFSHAHNDALNIAAYAGVPAAAIYLFIWGYLLYLFSRETLRRKRGSPGAAVLAASLAGLVVFFVASQTEAAFSDEEVRSFLMVLWGFGLWGLSPDPERTAISTAQAQL